MATLKLYRNEGTPKHSVARILVEHYDVAPDSVLFDGWTDLSEYVAVFVAPDGSAIAICSAYPDEYGKGPAGAPDDYEIDPGTFDIHSSWIVLTTTLEIR